MENIKFYLLRIFYILEGYYYLVLTKIKNVKHKELFDARYNMCIKCKHREGNICGKCKCVLTAKTKSLHSKCPIGKW